MKATDNKTNIEELQEALDYMDVGLTGPSAIVWTAARQWLHPNIEAAAKAYKEEWSRWWDDGRGLEAADPYEAEIRVMRAAVAAALGQPRKPR